MVRVTVHYARDGITYMRGECGANSVSSAVELAQITCEKCRKLIEQRLAGHLQRVMG